MCHTVSMSTNTYRVPTGHALDADSRGIVNITIAHQTRTHWWITVTDDELNELVSDARHYADQDSGLSRYAVAARAFLAAIDAGPVTKIPAARAKRKWKCPECHTEWNTKPAARTCLDCRDRGVR